MIRNRRKAGFTLIELMIVVAIIAIIAAVAIPKLMSARISANENAAVATLRSIAAAQQQFQAACAIDTDADGGGEYGFFGELAGTAYMRIFDETIPGPAPGAVADDYLDPPFLATAFGNIQSDPNTHGVVERQGYFFKIYLPGPTAAGLIPGIAEADTNTATIKGGADAADVTPANWGSANSEVLWCAYAWPSEHGKTGTRTFFINQEGDLLQTQNRDGEYNGIALAANVPVWSAAYSNDAVSMDSGLGLAVMGETANDTNIWTQVGN